MRLWGIRGAITVEADTKSALAEAVSLLVGEIMLRNSLQPEDIVSAIFTTTPDLKCGFPATFARQEAGWSSVPMLCMHELAPEGSLPMCLRVLVHAYLPAQPKNVYLRGAKALRPDLVGREKEDES